LLSYGTAADLILQLDVKNITWENITVYDGEQSPFVINQCYNIGSSVNCSTSLFEISDIRYSNVQGTVNTSYVGKFQCSRSAGGCDGVKMDAVDLINISTNPPEPAKRISCSNVNSPVGFKCG
jgi:hypothetical protein